MNIKGLLLGSAAALVAVSGARAADAVVIAEPEPMEYVRICDTYGAGFYYIPGTETCLKFSGYMRYQIGVGNKGFQDVWNKDSNSYDDYDFDGDGETNDTYSKTARFQLRVDARQETELGTLRAYAAVNFDSKNYANTPALYDDGDFSYPYVVDGWTTTGDSIGIEHAYIELGGFRVGKTDTVYNIITGFGGATISDDAGIGYGGDTNNSISYTFTGGNGFSAVIGLDEGEGTDAIDSYVPHVAGGLAYAAGWGAISGAFGYDSNYETWAGKIRGDLNVGDSLTLFAMFGLADDDGVQNFYKGWGGDWAIWGGGTWTFNEKAALNVTAAYDDSEAFGIAANIDYKLVNNFSIIPEVTYNDDNSDVTDEWGGYLRFQYNWGS